MAFDFKHLSSRAWVQVPGSVSPLDLGIIRQPSLNWNPAWASSCQRAHLGISQHLPDWGRVVQWMKERPLPLTSGRMEVGKV